MTLLVSQEALLGLSLQILEPSDCCETAIVFLYGVVKNLSREKVSLPSLVVGGGWQRTQVVQSSLDGLRDGRGCGQDAALRLEAVLVSDVVDDDGDAVVTGVGVRADDSQGLVLGARVLQLSVRLGGDAVLRLETRTTSRF